jgi:alkanesulfonate monooxygenase SsuD/methylene tetrahydromethanopterin reductase-like flavin-dependent oxidoreductase (luciferase family)
VVVGDDIAKAKDAARLPLAYYVGGMGRYYHASLSRLGFSMESNRIRAAWRAGRVREATNAVSDEMVDQLAICGPLEKCRAALDETYAMGATLPLVPIPAGGTLAEKCRLIESLIAT